MPDKSLNLQPNSTSLVSDVLRERTTAQLAQVDGLDTKAASALGFAGVLLGLMFANSSIDAEWNAWMTVAVVLLVLSAFSMSCSLWVRDWMSSPSDADLRSWQGKARGMTEAILAAGLERALAHNRKRAARKAFAIRVGLALLTAAIVIAAVGLLVARAHASERSEHVRGGAPSGCSASWPLRSDDETPTLCPRRYTPRGCLAGLLKPGIMSDETPQQAPEDQSAATSEPAVEPVPISEAEIQQAIHNSADWSQKSENSGRQEDR